MSFEEVTAHGFSLYPQILFIFFSLIVKNSAPFNIPGWDGCSGEGGSGGDRMEEGRE